MLPASGSSTSIKHLLVSLSLCLDRLRRSAVLSSPWQRKLRRWRGSTAQSSPHLTQMKVRLFAFFCFLLFYSFKRDSLGVKKVQHSRLLTSLPKTKLCVQSDRRAGGDLSSSEKTGEKLLFQHRGAFWGTCSVWIESMDWATVNTVKTCGPKQLDWGSVSSLLWNFM